MEEGKMRVVRNDEVLEHTDRPKDQTHVEDAYEKARQPTKAEIQQAQTTMLRNMAKELEYLEMLVRIQEAKQKLGAQQRMMEDVVKNAINETLRIVDCGLRKKEVYEKLGIIEDEDTTVSNNQQ